MLSRKRFNFPQRQFWKMSIRKIICFTVTFFLLLKLTLSAPTDNQPADVEIQKEELITEDKEDLKTSASHWGGHWGGYGGGYGGQWGGHWGGYYPYYGSYWGWPSYGGYGYGWPYGGHYGHHGYWW